MFLSHPAYPSSLFSLWWPSAVSAGGWKAAWWMQLVAPPLSLLIPILWPWLRNGECMEVAEDIEYSGIRMQNWVLSNFGYQYVLWPFRRLVEAPCLIFPCMSKSSLFACGRHRTSKRLIIFSSYLRRLMDSEIQQKAKGTHCQDRQAGRAPESVCPLPWSFEQGRMDEQWCLGDTVTL